MNITLNNQSNNNIILLSDVENIITFNEPSSGTYARIMLPFTNNLASTVSSDGQYYITLFDETITSVMQYKNATNRRFWISDNPTSTAASVANALRSCPSIMADWYITVDEYIVYLTAKRVGNRTGNYTYWGITNIPSTYLSIGTISTGSATSALLDGKANLEITQNGTTVARLSKQIYNQYTDFNISPTLSGDTDYGQVSTFTINPSTVNVSGNVATYQAMNVYMIRGYECNGSDAYLTPATTRILWNREHNGADNINYMYNNTVVFSVLTNTTNTQTIYFRLYDSAMNQLTVATNQLPVEGVPTITDSSYTFPQTAFTNAYYAEVQVGDEILQFRIVKPLKATEYFQRVYWRNEYGGIQFFDFTAQKSEMYNLSQLKYNVNTFNRYREATRQAEEKIYSNESVKTYTLTSHLMQRNGKYNLDSLALAKEVWTVVGDETYHIIPTQVTVTENDQYNNIYTATLSYQIA